MEKEEGSNLRYMQIHISIDSGINLPGSKLINFFSKVEFLSTIEKNSKGLICYASLEFDNPDALSNTYEGLEIIKILSKNNSSALTKTHLTGPVARLFTDDLDCWWVTPSHLTSSGMTLSLQGTKNSFQILRNKFSELVGNGFTVKIGQESIRKPISLKILNFKQKLVLDNAIKMGYYNRPRECTQRDIAKILNLKQSTVCEHLQLAESKIFNLMGIE
ncbi:MAG: hypothetical protein CND89_05780 [Marine Group II euryarchaeote MED-G38]|nr:MAG: hypothetical protein CBC57_05925 [Euryarchaeota archaeon TMED97]PDH21664.1 MAG: hypothetical protein CND89_05780 [Marine Group II euryarchaeote MED-G38]|tara:strand:- start:2923 stop:3576 length:654 start_codon:yes stop_codon:yes gene_type:complete